MLWQSRNNGSFQRLRAVLEALSPSPEERLTPGEPMRISLDDNRDFPTLRAPYGLDVPVVQASAGIKRILGLAYLLVWAWQEHAAASALLRQPPTRQILFLVDELEAHLHPRWQRSILRALVGVMASLTGDEQVAVQLLAATHSPLVMASMEPLFDPAKDALWLLDLEGGQVSLRRATWERRGDANRWLTSEVFELGSATSEEAEQALQRARALLRQEDPDPAEIRAVDEELGRLLPEMDPFFVRWRFFLQRSGQGAA